MDGVIWVEVEMRICFDVDTELGREMIALANVPYYEQQRFLNDAVFERIKDKLPELIDHCVATAHYADDEDYDLPF